MRQFGYLHGAMAFGPSKGLSSLVQEELDIPPVKDVPYQFQQTEIL